jgi:hypothetical protein
MRKRLRKKLRLGEFREFGFEVRFRLPADLDQAGQFAFFDSFIQEAIEGNGLVCGGRCGDAWDVFVTLGRRGTATEEHRTKVRCWLQEHSEVSGPVVGPLVDAWHSV